MVSDDLVPLCMAMEPYTTESLPRIWAIEALACSKQPRIPELIDLIRRTPDISADTGKKARELVCLKVLETLSAEGNQSNTEDPSTLHQKIEFDPSDSCEDVLGHILQEMSASNFKLTASKMLKWDVKSFIAHKRECLPIFALQKLKDSIHEGSLSFLASLKERGGVEVRTQFNHIPGTSDSPSASSLKERCGVEVRTQFNHIPGTSDSPSAAGQIPELSNKDIQIVCPNQNSCPNTIENGVAKLQEELPGRNSLLSKRKRTDISAGNLEREDRMMQDNIYDLHAESTKKFHITEVTCVPKSIKFVQDGLSENFAERIIKYMDRDGYNLENETEIGGMDTSHCDPTYEGGNRCARRSEISYASDGNGQLQNPMNDNTEANIPGEVQGRSNCADEANDHMKVVQEKASNGASLGANEDHDNMNKAENSCHQNVQGNTSTVCEANHGIKHNLVLEADIDQDKFHDERNDIASKKKAFLASQCTFSEDFLATEPIFCMKCYSGGQLLTCGSSTCPLVVHESCLGTAVKFDGDGIFYCPFCTYSRAISEYLEAKKKATLARKDLATFMDWKVTCQSQLPRRSPRLKQKKVRQVDGIFENNEANIDRDPLDQDVHTDIRHDVEENLQSKPPTSVAGNWRPSGQTSAHSTHGDAEILENAYLHGEGKGQNCQAPIQQGEEQKDVQAPQKYDSDISSHKQAGITKRNRRHKTSVAANGLPSGQEVAQSTHGEPDFLGNENFHDEVTEQQCQSPIQPREEQNEVQATQNSDSDISSHKQADISQRNQRQAGRRVQRKVKQPPESYIPSEPLNRTTSESSEEDGDKCPFSKYSMRSRRPEMQFTYPALPMARRKRCRWTKLEEDKLKEGVDKLSSNQDFIIPWKAILEFGAGVFEKGRTTVDLKDKWRNMTKGGSKS